MNGEAAIVNNFKIMIYILGLVFHVCHKNCLQNLNSNVNQAHTVLRIISFHSSLNVFLYFFSHL
jgi:hypothetical protein